MSRRPLPAYAADLAAARRRGFTLRKPIVSVVLHWRDRPLLGYGVVVPDDRDPAQLDWTWVRGLDVFVFRRGDASARVMAAVRAIETAGPRHLFVVDVAVVAGTKIISIVAPSSERRRAAA
jgi:hypothetical protein